MLDKLIITSILESFKMGILSHSKNIKVCENLTPKIKAFFDTVDGSTIMVDLKSKSWASKSTSWKDEGFQQICSIYYFETKWKGK